MGLFNTNPILFREDADVADVMPVDPEDFHDADPVGDANTDGIDAADPIISAPVEECYKFMTEAETNWNTIMQSIGLHEMSVFATTGSDVVYEAADGQSFIQSMIAFFKKMGASIAEAFHKVINALKEKFGANRNFYKKYGTKVEAGYKKLTDKMTFSGYNFSAEVTGANYVLGDKLSKSMDAVDSVVNGTLDANTVSDLEDSVRGNFCGTSVVSAADYVGALKKSFFGEKKVTIKYTSYTLDAIKKIGDEARYIDNVKKQYSDIRKSLKTIISTLNKAASNMKGKDEDTQNALAATKAGCALAKGLIKIAHVASIQYCSALNGYINQKKMVAMACVKMANGKAPEKIEGKAVKESTGLGFLSDLELI